MLHLIHLAAFCAPYGMPIPERCVSAEIDNSYAINPISLAGDPYPPFSPIADGMPFFYLGDTAWELFQLKQQSYLAWLAQVSDEQKRM